MQQGLSILQKKALLETITILLLENSCKTKLIYIPLQLFTNICYHIYNISISDTLLITHIINRNYEKIFSPNRSITCRYNNS
jgi:hypothetical protein